MKKNGEFKKTKHRALKGSRCDWGSMQEVAIMARLSAPLARHISKVNGRVSPPSSDIDLVGPHGSI